MFSNFTKTTSNILNSISSGLSWILSNKKSIAIFALMMTAGRASAEIGRRKIFHFECGSFEVTKSDEASAILSTYEKPVSFTASLFDVPRECFSISGNVIYCNPLPDYPNENPVQIFSTCNEVCNAFTGLSLTGQIKNPSRFFNKNSRPEAKKYIDHLIDFRKEL